MKKKKEVEAVNKVGRPKNGDKTVLLLDQKLKQLYRSVVVADAQIVLIREIKNQLSL